MQVLLIEEEMRESFSREQMQSGVLVCANPHPCVEVSGPPPPPCILTPRSLEILVQEHSRMWYDLCPVQTGTYA